MSIASQIHIECLAKNGEVFLLRQFPSILMLHHTQFVYGVCNTDEIDLVALLAYKSNGAVERRRLGFLLRVFLLHIAENTAEDCVHDCLRFVPSRMLLSTITARTLSLALSDGKASQLASGMMPLMASESRYI